MKNPFRYFKTSPEIIRLAVMMYVRFPLSLRQVEDLLHERGIDVSYEAVRYWWNRFGPIFAAKIKEKRSAQMRTTTQWAGIWMRFSCGSMAQLTTYGGPLITKVKFLNLSSLGSEIARQR